MTEPEGTLELRRGQWYVRVSLPDGTRPRFRLPEGLDEADRERMKVEISRRERARVRAELEAAESTRLTVQQFGERWTSGELYRLHGEVKRLRPKASAADDAERLASYVYPVIGDKRVADVTEIDIERVLAEAPTRFRERRGREMQPATKRHVYQVMHRLFDLAVRPGRLREDSPVGEHLKPAAGSPKLYGYLFPAELLQLLACRKVPVARRVLYATATYTGLRRGSLYGLTWEAIDFVHGTMAVLVTKNGVPQLVDLEPMSAELLQAWYERCGSPPPASPIIRDLKMRPDREAETLRADLELAGVKRAMLFGGAGAVKAMRFHDLRASFVTWALRQGRGKFWIQDRTGHLTEAMLTRYARQARTLADLRLEPFPAIGKAIPELGELPANVRRMRRRFWGSGTGY